MSRFHYGMNSRDFDREFRQLGGFVEAVRRTGERRYSHPRVATTVRADGRRKDTPMHVVKFGREVERLLSDGFDEHDPAA